MANLTNEGYFEAIQAVSCASSLHGKSYLYSLAALNIILSITASLGNILILVALHKESSLYPPSKLLFRCLAVTDLLAGVISQPLLAVQLISIAHQGLELCYAIVSINDIAGRSLSGVSLCTLTAISVDRLLALLLGLKYRQTVTLRPMRGMVISFWILNILTFSLRRFFISRDIISRVTSAVIYTFLTASACSYIKIYLTLRHRQAQRENHFHQAQPNGIPLNIARYRKTVSIALWVQLTLVACYLPYGILSTIAHPYTPSHNLAGRTTFTLILLNSSLNPVLYCWKIRGVRREVKNIIRQMCCLS